MAVVKLGSDFIIISHEQYINKLYRKTNFNGKFQSYQVRKDLFTCKPYKVLGKKSKTRRYFSEEVSKIIQRYQELEPELANVLRDSEAFDLLFCLTTTESSDDNFCGGNDSSNAIIAEVGGSQFLVPPRCQFYNYDVNVLSDHIKDKFNLITMDPPWWNKYIRRKRKRNITEAYNMMWDHDVAALPIADLLSEDGLVAVWCTNANSHIDAVKLQFFPKWGLEFVAQWYWLKVTRKGEVVCPFSEENGKQPFERILFGRRSGSRQFRLPESGKLLVSVPSAIHSHKPPLSDIMQPYLPSNPKCLELFARYLVPGWTSYGNEVLKLQNLSLFSEGEGFAML